MTTQRPPSTIERDHADTGFSRHLDALPHQVPEALCAVFIDAEGEAIDLATRMPLFDARITGAEIAIVLSSVRAASTKLKQGETLETRIEGSKRSMVARHVAEGCDLVLLVAAPSISAHTAEVTAASAIALLVESGLKPSPSYSVLRSVEQRPNRAGMTVPSAFEDFGVRRKIEAVLGHRSEDGEAKFLVRLDNGEELIMVHDRVNGCWKRG